MKRMIRAQEEIFAMSKISNKYAIPAIKDDIDSFIYFSEFNSSHGPRIKFYGGTKETSSTKDSPTLAFDNEGNCQLELADWMDRDNCPNAFDSKYIAKMKYFVKSNLPILLLVWFKHIDEADALAYFHGQINFHELIDLADIDLVNDLNDDFTIDDDDNICRSLNYYEF